MDNSSKALADYRERLLHRGLSPRHREAMRLVASGMPLNEVADRLGYSRSRLYQVTRSPLWQRELDKLMGRLDNQAYDAMAAVRALQPQAVNTYKDLLECELYEELRFKIAKDILDRTGVTAPTVSHSITASQSYEQELSKVRVDYTKTTNYGPSPIEVIGGTELAEEPGDDD